MEDTVVTLPSAAEMAHRLNAMDASEKERRFLHPLLLEKAGRQMSAPSFMLTLNLGINSIAPQTSHIEWNDITSKMNLYADILIDNPQALDQAKRFRLPV